MKSRRSMALPKQSAFHGSTSASTLLLTAGLDYMDKLASVHKHTLFYALAVAQSHTWQNKQFSVIPYSFIHTFTFVYTVMEGWIDVVPSLPSPAPLGCSTCRNQQGYYRTASKWLWKTSALWFLSPHMYDCAAVPVPENLTMSNLH